jgi:hypothetical protein
MYRAGLDIFDGSSQSGTNSNVPAVIQVETALPTEYYCRIQRISDNFYYNALTRSYQFFDPPPSEEIMIPGSLEASPNSIRRLQMRIPDEARDGINSEGAVYTIYAPVDTPDYGVAIVTTPLP